MVELFNVDKEIYIRKWFWKLEAGSFALNGLIKWDARYPIYDNIATFFKNQKTPLIAIYGFHIILIWLLPIGIWFIEPRIRKLLYTDTSIEPDED